MAVQTPTPTPTPTAPPPARRAGRPTRGSWILVLLLAVVAAVGIVIAVRPAPAALTPQVVPASVGDAIPGQPIVLLVTFSDDAAVSDLAQVTAEPLEFVDDVTVAVSPDRIALGITADTTWTPAIVQPHILVVSHYLFFSEDWEMGLMWHIMIAPHDWSRIYLRPRGEMTPTMAFEIPSVSDPTSAIREIEVPTHVDR